MKRYVNASSWSDINSGKYSNYIKPDYTPVDIAGYKLTISDTIDEMDNLFWFDDDSEGGTGGTTFFGIGELTNDEDSALDYIHFKFWVSYDILGVLDNPDEFYLYEPDRGLDKDAGVELELYESTFSEGYANAFLEEHHDEIFDAIIEIINKNLNKFGYEL